jgi:hypothetical protein
VQDERVSLAFEKNLQPAQNVSIALDLNINLQIVRIFRTYILWKSYLLKRHIL